MLVVRISLMSFLYDIWEYERSIYMAEHIINFSIDAVGDRNKVRMKVVNELSKEEPGQGKKDLASRYTYYVETLNDGNRIYLRRPANLHNGFDFVVGVENINFNPNGRRRSYPKHDDIIIDLTEKKKESSEKYKQLYSVLIKVYKCESIDDSEMKLTFKTGFSTELIIKTLKWLFIEQDIRYWNYSGRDMLWNAIKSI